MMLFVVKYSGAFGFIKPWTAVRDGETYSQQFLTPSMLQGLEIKLFPELLEKHSKKILRHRLYYSGISMQKERTQPRGFTIKKKGKRVISLERSRSIIDRGVLVEPELFLAFASADDAARAANQHICLARNEDLMLPDPEIVEMTEEEFDNNLPGFELVEVPGEEGFLVGYNRFKGSEEMFGQIKVFGNPNRK